MTGATSGLGLEAARRLLEAGHDDITVGARNPTALPPEIGGRVTALPLDLAEFDSVREFAIEVAKGPQIDALVLNAGLQLAGAPQQAEGFEKTFAVNHLAHFLLLDILRDALSLDARVILTGSGTHDPAEGTPITPPDHADAALLAHPENDPQAPEGRKYQMRAYSSSKLCNIMTARELPKRKPGITSLAYDPAYVPGTGLSREYPKWLQRIAEPVIKLFIAKDRVSTVENSGARLAELVTDEKYAGAQGDYWSVRGDLFVKVEPSELARDDAACARLWDDSEKLLGLTPH